MTDLPEPDREDRPDDEPTAPGDEAAMDGDRDEAMDALIAGAHVSRGSVMDDGMNGNGYVPLTTPEVGRIQKRIERFLQEEDERPPGRRMTRARLAKAIGASASTLSQILACKYPKGKDTGYRRRDEVLRQLDRFLTLHEARADAPQRSGFVWTRVAEEIRAVAQTCVLLENIGAAHGPAGIGKTLTVTALQDMWPGAVLVTVHDGTHSPTTFLRELSDRLKLDSIRYRQSMRRIICDALRGSRRLVIVDEAHLATLETLNCLRQIHDSTGVPALLVGLPALARMLMRGRGDDSRGATLYSRVGICRDLTERCRRGGDRGEPLYSTEDIKRVFAQSQVRIAPAALDWLEGLANEPEAGGLRMANNTLRLALHVARTSAEPVREITLTMLLEASRLLKGTEAAKAIANRVKQRQAARVA